MTTGVDIKVRGYHLDLYGHVNNARYLEFLEEARWAVFEAHCDLASLSARQLAFVIANININYRLPATMGDVLTISVELARIGSRSATLHQRVVNQQTGAVVADAEVTIVVVDGASAKESGHRTPKAVELTGSLRSELDKLPRKPGF